MELIIIVRWNYKNYPCQINCITNVLSLFDYLLMEVIVRYFNCTDISRILSENNTIRKYEISELHLANFKIK